ncbi:MAG: hypothetical protein LBK75_03040 [Oscillospiraceae bacterium]|nr:hypothetical protein [Oscillospiraceae bacterium]
MVGVLKNADEVGTLVKGVGKNADNIAGAGKQIENVFTSIRKAASYPNGFESARNGLKKITINNSELLENLRKIEPGEWKKIYQDGYVDGSKVSIHYFQHTKTGKIFDVKSYFGKWSNSSSR